MKNTKSKHWFLSEEIIKVLEKQDFSEIYSIEHLFPVFQSADIIVQSNKLLTSLNMSCKLDESVSIYSQRLCFIFHDCLITNNEEKTEEVFFYVDTYDNITRLAFNRITELSQAKTIRKNLKGTVFETILQRFNIPLEFWEHPEYNGDCDDTESIFIESPKEKVVEIIFETIKEYAEKKS